MQNKPEDCVQLLNVGEEVYRIGKNGIETVTIVKAESYPHYVYRDNEGRSYFNRALGTTLFKTEGEAEEEVRRRQCIIEKRRLLREYERELNVKMNITNHVIVK